MITSVEQASKHDGPRVVLSGAELDVCLTLLSAYVQGTDDALVAKVGLAILQAVEQDEQERASYKVPTGVAGYL